MRLLFAVLIGISVLACSSATPLAQPTATPVPTVNSPETTARVGLPFRLEDRDVMYRVVRNGLDVVFAGFESPLVKDTEVSSICQMLGESGWQVRKLYVHPSINPRLQLVAGSLEGAFREINRIFREEKPDTWPGYSIADFCEDFQRAG